MASYKDIRWISQAKEGARKSIYGGFWPRLGAFAIDNFIIVVLAVILTPLLQASYKEIQPFFLHPLDDIAQPLLFLLPAVVDSPSLFLILLSIIAFIYYSFFIASPVQATIGKWLFGLYVATVHGKQVVLARGIIRFFGYIVSALPFCAGFIMAAFNPERKALHDILSKTRVFAGHPSQVSFFKEQDYIDILSNKSRNPLGEFVSPPKSKKDKGKNSGSW